MNATSPRTIEPTKTDRAPALAAELEALRDKQRSHEAAVASTVHALEGADFTLRETRRLQTEHARRKPSQPRSGAASDQCVGFTQRGHRCSNTGRYVSSSGTATFRYCGVHRSQVSPIEREHERAQASWNREHAVWAATNRELTGGVETAKKRQRDLREELRSARSLAEETRRACVATQASLDHAIWMARSADTRHELGIAIELLPSFDCPDAREQAGAVRFGVEILEGAVADPAQRVRFWMDMFTYGGATASGRVVTIGDLRSLAPSTATCVPVVVKGLKAVAAQLEAGSRAAIAAGIVLVGLLTTVAVVSPALGALSLAAWLLVGLGVLRVNTAAGAAVIARATRAEEVTRQRIAGLPTPALLSAWNRG